MRNISAAKITHQTITVCSSRRQKIKGRIKKDKTREREGGEVGDGGGDEGEEE